MAKQHDKQFKLDAVQYYQDHKDLGVRGCAENLEMCIRDRDERNAALQYGTIEDLAFP